MRIGIPRETKEGERRVALLPPAVAELASAGHEVRVEAGAGAGVDCGDDAYLAAGARRADASQAWSADLVVKVKEILEKDLPHVPQWATVFSFQHLPREPARVRDLAARGITAIAFEMVRDAHGQFPLLAPMSAIAGRMAVDIGAGLLGRDPDRVLVLGAGHAGRAAAAEARRRGVGVVVLTRGERSRDAARAQGFESALASTAAIEREALAAELVVGAVFVPAQPTPKLLPRPLVRRMRRGSVIVDVSIDAGGIAETSRPTTHADPVFVEEGVVHYCVANMPAANPPEATRAISSAVLPFVRTLADHGIEGAVLASPALREAVLLWRGQVTHPGIAAEAGLPFVALHEAMNARSGVRK
ncbi:MAG TPA: FAD-binding protein [Usitatibacter sp.]|nr:FAD-binding protein [Usitatibacter sp.]